MKCPKCDAAMESVKYQEIEVDRCSSCGGLWFDMLEKEDLKALKGAEAIDTGGRSTGAKFNKVADVDCPVCHVKMIRMVDKDQPNIWFESCTSCYGVFFDAGEFRDYKSSNILDFFQYLLRGERR